MNKLVNYLRTKRIFKYFNGHLGWFSFYLFQDGRWTFGITLDINGYPLVAFDFFFIHLEIELPVNLYRTNYRIIFQNVFNAFLILLIFIVWLAIYLKE